MKSREEIIQTLKDNTTELRNRYRVHRIALFGSYARGDQREDSDVDILVDFDPSIGLGFVSLAEELERLLGVSVELVSSRAISPRMKKAIEEDLIEVA